ncbi:MAG: hypothetical protein HY052_05115 [Proteobacteria bacterium]|nr:hypothetical protein [Pseudomonadota bacterium]
MSDRWNLSKLITAISYKQFQNLTAAFQQAAERSFDTDTTIEITALQADKVCSPYVDDAIQADHDSLNQSNTLLKTNKLSELTADIWKKAKYVEVSVNPVNKSKAPHSYSFANVEFKGTHPRQATFYIQGEQEEGAAKKSVLTNRPLLSTVGDGFDGNGVQDGRLPASLADFRFYIGGG